MHIYVKNNLAKVHRDQKLIETGYWRGRANNFKQREEEQQEEQDEIRSWSNNVFTFLERDSIICYSTLYAIARPSVRPFVRLLHGWISQRQLKLGSYNLHHRVAPWL